MSDLETIECAEEVRHGLFRYKWCFEEKMQKDGDVHKKSFKLTGSEAGRTFTIDYRLSKNKKNFGKFFTFKENLSKGNSTVSELDLTVPNQQEVSQLEQSFNNASPIYRKKQKLNVPASPLSVWICRNKSNGNEFVFHFHKFSDYWKTSWYGPSRLLNAITVWIDFGITSVKQDNIVNTAKKLTRMFLDQTNCDVQFLFKNGESIGAHILILSAGSPVFSAMFQSGFKESQTRQVTIDDIEPEVFRQLLIYFYSGEVPKLPTQVDLKATQVLFEVAEKYAVEKLKEECTDMLLKQVNLETVVTLLVWSHFHSIPELYDIAMKFLVENFRVISFQPEWTDIIKNHPDLCLEATQRMSVLLPSPTTSKV
jgi:hypothetical protein